MENFTILAPISRKTQARLAFAAFIMGEAMIGCPGPVLAQSQPQMQSQPQTQSSTQSQTQPPQWVFVPGSRQAKPVSSVQGQPYSSSYQQPQSQGMSTRQGYQRQQGYAQSQGTTGQNGQGQQQLPLRQVSTPHGTYVLVPRNGPPVNAPGQGQVSSQGMTDRQSRQTGVTEIQQGQSRQQGQSGQGQASQQSQSRQQSAAAAARPATKTAAGKNYDYTGTAVVGGAQRPYQAHIPASCDRSRPSPVVLVFHGLHMNGTMMRGVTGFDKLSNQKGFIVIYGEALGNWSDGRSNSADDVAYVTAVLDSLGRVAKVDTRRVYACGISNGAYFCQVLACALPDRIASVGVVGATLLEQASTSLQTGRPVPIVFFLGTEDPLLPWGDGRTKDLGKLGESLGLSGIGSIDSPLARIGGLMSVPEVINFWAGHNHCSTTPYKSQVPVRDASDGTQVKKESYGSTGNEVVLYTIEGGEHSWPGALDVKAMADVMGKTTHNLDASEALWDFFQSHSR